MPSIWQRTLAVLVIMVCGIGGATAGPAILFDSASGTVFYAEDPDRTWYPASLTKMLTAYIAFEEIKAGRLTLEDKLISSKTARAEPPSKIGLPLGAEMSVDLGLRSLIVKSANDVAVMFAEKISGNVASFSQRMNETAYRLGMTRSNFVNPNGLPDQRQITTARDMGKLARALIRDHPNYGEYFAMPTMRIGKIKLSSHNALLKHFEGADGMKTGFICDSGFNIAASATRNGQRLVAIVLGGETARDRNARAVALLNHGFDTFLWNTLFGKGNIDTMAADPAKVTQVQSIRRSVKMSSCGYRPSRNGSETASDDRSSKGKSRKRDRKEVSQGNGGRR